MELVLVEVMQFFYIIRKRGISSLPSFTSEHLNTSVCSSPQRLTHTKNKSQQSVLLVQHSRRIIFWTQCYFFAATLGSNHITELHVSPSCVSITRSSM